MEILTYKKVYQLVGDNTSGTNECITKSAAVQIAESHRKNVTSNLSQYLNNEYIDVFAVEDKPDLSVFSFANNRYNPQAAGNTYTTAVSSRDIDGNTIVYNATADVDWITDIVINSTEIKFKVAANMGDQRTGHITGSNATGKSDTITIVQEAKEANLDYTYSLVATCTSVPTVTINGTTITRYTTSGNAYTFQYTTRVRTESEAPASVDFTISGGGAGDTYNEGTLSISPTSWDLNDGLSKQFTVGYSRVKTTKTWDHTTGTIVRNGSTNVSLNTTTATEYPTIDYTIRDTHPSGQSFSHSKNGMKFTSAASSTSCTGSVTVAYGSLSATANVFYTEPVYDSYTYTVKASDTNTSSTPTITINGQAATVTHSGGYYVGKITISDSATTSAPDSVSWSISGGTKATEWGSYNVSISPDSWNLDDGLTKEFEVSMYQSGTKYDWRTSSGTVAKNREVSTDVTSSSTSYTCSSYSISGPSGITFSQNGTSFTATASGTGSTGTITVTCTEFDANGESATCNVVYNPALKSWTYTVNATCPERPTITIGGEDATVTGDSDDWVGTRVIISQDDPGEKSYSVTAGSNSRTWGDIHVSVSPSSITIKEAPADISFTAYAYQEYDDYTPYTASGTTSNKRAACKPTRSYESGESESEMCSISASNVSGLPGSMQVSKYGTTISGTANGSGSVTVTCTYYDHNTDHTYRDSDTCDIIYEKETFPDWTNDMYVFGWGVRGGESVVTTSISCEFDPVTFQPNSEWLYYSIVSYRSRTGSHGTVQKEYVGYTGNGQTAPSAPNTTGQVISDSGELVQNNSGKTAQWSWTQGTETFPDWTNDMYVFGWGVRGGESVVTTSISCEFDPVTFQPNSEWLYYSIVSYRSRTGSHGTVQKEYVGYTGNGQTAPSAPNTTGQVISDSGELVQNNSGKTAQWSWTQGTETFPDKWTYVFTWDDNSSKINGYFDVNGNEKSGGTYGSATVVSYRTKTGTAGTIKKEDVSYSGSKESPSGVNMNDAELGSSGKLIQAGSNKTIEWEWSQDANEYVYGAECSALATYDGNGQFLHISNKTVSLTRAFKYGNDTQKQYDTEDAKYSESVPANPTVSEKTWTENYTASNGAVYSVSYRQLGKLMADKTVTISVSRVNNTFNSYNVTFEASEALEKDITISYTVTYKLEFDQSFAHTSRSCVLGSGATLVSDSGPLPIKSSVESNSAYVSSMSASPSSYTNSYSGTTIISCDI